MRKPSMKGQRGFSLLEMTIGMAVGTVVLAAAVQMYSQGVSATWVATQRSEMQQDFRAAGNMLTRDLSLAGAGLGNNVQVALINAAKKPIYGCDQSGKWSSIWRVLTPMPLCICTMPTARHRPIPRQAAFLTCIG